MLLRVRNAALGMLLLAGLLLNALCWWQASILVHNPVEKRKPPQRAPDAMGLIYQDVQVQAADVQQKLQAGETARYAVDCQHSIRNLGKSVATAWLVVVHPA